MSCHLLMSYGSLDQMLDMRVFFDRHEHSFIFPTIPDYFLRFIERGASFLEPTRLWPVVRRFTKLRPPEPDVGPKRHQLSSLFFCVRVC